MGAGVTRRSQVLGVAVLLSLVVALGAIAAPDAAALPAGFVDEAVTGVPSPTAFDFLADGRILAASQGGQLWLITGGQRRAAPVLDLSGRVCSNSERGLLGVAVRPGGRPHIYLYYTRDDAGTCENRVARFTLGAGDTIDPATELVLLDGIPSPGGNHNAGDLQFGADGALYVAVGDGGTGPGGGAGANAAARNPNTLLGKILRISADGPGIPAGNPNPGGAACGPDASAPAPAPCRETYASGFRNPFRMAFDETGTRLFANDVGQGAWEEVDEVVAGADYGWNVCEGAHDNPARAGSEDCTAGAYEPPVHEYPHRSGCRSITGGAFVPSGVWPAEYDGAYLYGDFVCGTIFRVGPDGSGPPVTVLDGPTTASVVALRFGTADAALYYTTYADGGSLRRLRYVGDGNRPPTAALTATPTSGAVPLEVAFDASASSDPDGDTLSYTWDFGDGGAPQTTTSPSATHTYERAGAFDASVVATDARGAASAPATARIGPGNTAPQVAIEGVPEGGYAAGERLSLRATATDAEDGEVGGDALRWTVTLHHDTHTHPLVPPTPGATLAFSAPPPEDLAAVPTTWLEATLTATDAAGATATASARLDPRTVTVTVGSDPPGLTVRVNGTDLTAPATFPSVPCYPLTLVAPDQRAADGTAVTFASWSDGGPRLRTVLTPDADLEVTATSAPGGTGADAGGGVPISRVGGESRIDTAVALSAQRFPACGADGPLADTVVLARADAYPDALAGGPLAAARQAPILLTGADALSPAARGEIVRLGAGRAVLLGGEAALSAAVDAELTAMGLDVERIGGPDRFATAAAVAAALPPSAEAYLVEGANADPARGWPDAVSVSWLAARSGTPILLTTRDELPVATAAALAQRGVTRTIVVGGAAAVAEPLLGQVAGGGVTVTRVAGATRYDTARALLDGAGELSGVTVYLTTGADFPDALAAGPAVAARGGVLLPVDPRSLDTSTATAEWFAQAGDTLAGVVLVGGPGAIAPRVEADLADLLAP